jgi:hypothetical protein
VRPALAGEEQCAARRSTREAIAKRYPVELLPSGGLLPREVRSDARRAAWLALPADERARRVARLRPFGRTGKADTPTSEPPGTPEHA